MPTIKFERFERECGHNEQARKDGSQLLYDYRVIIDGEFRALWSRQSYASRDELYRLYDPDHRPILIDPEQYHKHMGAPVPNKAAFEAAIAEALAGNRIPTLAQLAELTKAEERARLAALVKAQEVLRENRIESAAQALFDALEAAAVFKADFDPATRSAVEDALNLARHGGAPGTLMLDLRKATLALNEPGIRMIDSSGMQIGAVLPDPGQGGGNSYWWADLALAEATESQNG